MPIQGGLLMNRWAFGGMLLALACGAHAQDAVKCQDANGRIVYVDRACELYGLHEIGPVKDRVSVAPTKPQTDTREAVPAPPPQQDMGAQTPQGGQPARELARERALKRCEENRGIDCESKKGLREYLREDRPITVEQQQAAGAARHLRELCEKDPTAFACQDPNMQ